MKRLESRSVDGLDGPLKDEAPSDIFIDVTKYGGNKALIQRLRQAAVSLLTRLASQPSLDHIQALGDICHMSTALGARDATLPLAHLMERKEAADALLPNGEDLRLRALRCVVGLLGAGLTAAPREAFQPSFESLLNNPKYRLLALIGLVGLWPERRTQFLARTSGGVSESELDEGLEWAGFDIAGHTP